MQWKDATSYSRNNKERVPTTWEAIPHPDLRIAVTCGHIAWKGRWIMHCRPWFDTYPLGADIATAEEAQKRAILLVKKRVRETVAALAESD